MKAAKILWNGMAVIGIIVTISTIGEKLIELANFIISTIQQMGV